MATRGARIVKTIGHSSRTVDELIEMLTANGVTMVVDVRRMPRSAANPQFNAESLAADLADAGIAYTAIPELFGLRKRTRDSINTGWRNKSFQAYADYMQTPEFASGLARLIALAGREVPAVMCAEAVPWRCHRSLIADALVARGIGVLHILSASRAQAHFLRDFAHVEGHRVTYPAPRDEAPESRL